MLKPSLAQGQGVRPCGEHWHKAIYSREVSNISHSILRLCSCLPRTSKPASLLTAERLDKVIFALVLSRFVRRRNDTSISASTKMTDYLFFYLRLYLRLCLCPLGLHVHALLLRLCLCLRRILVNQT